MQHICIETHDFDLTHNHFTKMAQLVTTIGTTAVLGSVLPHCGHTAPTPAVLPLPKEVQNSPITSPLEIPYLTHAVVPPCGTTSNHSAILPLLEKSKALCSSRTPPLENTYRPSGGTSVARYFRRAQAGTSVVIAVRTVRTTHLIWTVRFQSDVHKTFHVRPVRTAHSSRTVRSRSDVQTN